MLDIDKLRYSLELNNYYRLLIIELVKDCKNIDKINSINSKIVKLNNQLNNVSTML